MKHLILILTLLLNAMSTLAQGTLQEACQFYTQKQYSKAVPIFQKLATEGLPEAQYNLGVCYDNGYGIQQDYKKAVYWYEKAAMQGIAIAQCNLGVCYYNGYGIQQDYKKAVYWYEKAAMQGDDDAQFNLALCYKNGKGIQQDDKKAVYWYEKAAMQGHARAQFTLALCYKNGEGIQQDDKKAVYWYKKGAAMQGNTDALLNVGRIDDAIKAYLAVKGEECTYKEYDNFADIYLKQSEAAADEAAKKAALQKAADIYGTIAEKYDYAAVYALFKQANVFHAINPDLKVGLAMPYYKKLAEKIESLPEKTAADLKKLGTAYQYLAVHYIQNDKIADAKQWAAKLLEVRPDDETAKQIMELK